MSFNSTLENVQCPLCCNLSKVMHSRDKVQLTGFVDISLNQHINDFESYQVHKFQTSHDEAIWDLPTDKILMLLTS